MKRANMNIRISVIFLFIMFLGSAAFADQSAKQKTLHPEIVKKAQMLTVPFILNKGQVDARVKFYAHTFGATIYVTNEGDGNVSVINTAMNTVTDTISVGRFPREVVFVNSTPLPPPVVNFSTSSINFSPVLVGESSSPQIVTVTNRGGRSLRISGISVSGDFSHTDDCGYYLHEGSSCTISVTFSPRADGSRRGLLTVTDNAAGNPHIVTLSGVGTFPICGNGIIEQGEQCDPPDGETCNSRCQIMSLPPECRRAPCPPSPIE